MYIPVVIHKDAESDYGVTIPDIPGCYSAGIDFADALKNAKDAVLFHLEGLLEDGELPKFEFRRIEDLHQSDEYKDGIFSLIELDLSELSAEPTRFNVSWPKYILTILDASLKESHETRSGFLAKLVLKSLQHQRISETNQ